jgi:hypothetical protein
VSAAADFVDALFPREVDYPAGASAVLYTLPGKTTHPFPPGDWERLIAQAAALSSRENVYLHVALHDRARLGGRGSNESAVVLPALFDDLDVLLPGHRHKGTALPKTIEEARSFLDEMPWPPSLLVHTGFGLQPWWILREPLLLDDPDDRAMAETLLARYKQHRDVVAKAHEWAFDTVHDLARVLRLPGTMNVKNPDAVREVTILETNGRRFNPTDLLDAMPPLEVEEPAPPAGPVLFGAARTEQVQGLDRAARRRAIGTLGRNPAGFWLACQLRDAGLTAEEALESGAAYTAWVDRAWPDREYGRREEFAESVRQAFGRAARAPLSTLADLISVEHVHDGREKTLRKLARELYFRHVDDDLIDSLVTMLNAARCRPPLAADDLVRIIDEEKAGIEAWRARRAS